MMPITNDTIHMDNPKFDERDTAEFKAVTEPEKATQPLEAVTQEMEVVTEEDSLETGTYYAIDVPGIFQDNMTGYIANKLSTVDDTGTIQALNYEGYLNLMDVILPNTTELACGGERELTEAELQVVGRKLIDIKDISNELTLELGKSNYSKEVIAIFRGIPNLLPDLGDNSDAEKAEKVMIETLGEGNFERLYSYADEPEYYGTRLISLMVYGV